MLSNSYINNSETVLVNNIDLKNTKKSYKASHYEWNKKELKELQLSTSIKIIHEHFPLKGRSLRNKSLKQIYKACQGRL